MARRDETDETDAAGASSQRVDKWLWHARLVKTRALAVEIVEAGKVRRNRERLTKPADQVRVGDVLTVTLPSRIALVKVLGFAERRGSAEDTVGLIEDLSPRAPVAGGVAVETHSECVGLGLVTVTIPMAGCDQPERSAIA
eukprot:gene42270-52527_t